MRVFHLKSSDDRVPDDLYPTPPYAMDILYDSGVLDTVGINDIIWEPAAGYGHMSRYMESKGLKVWSSDIKGIYTNIDFLLCDTVPFNVNGKIHIITNPPYKNAQKFVEKAIELSNGMVIMLLRMCFLESASRYNLFSRNNPSKVIVLSKRLQQWDGKKFFGTWGQFSHAWFIWDKDYQGPTILEWAL